MQGSEARVAAMRLGWLETVAAPGSPDAGVVAEAVAAVEAEGFDAIWLRAAPGGGDGTVLFAAALAGLTVRARIGIAAPPCAGLHPLRLAEDLAMIDVASGGRLDWIPTRNGAMSADEHAEYVHVVLEAWCGEAFGHAGPRWPFPEVVCVPSPEQRPHPPLWLGRGATPPSGTDAALTGLWLDDRQSVADSDGTARRALVCRLHDAPEAGAADGIVGGPLSGSHGHETAGEGGEPIVVSGDPARVRDELAPLLETVRPHWLIAEAGPSRRNAEGAAARRRGLVEAFAELGAR